MNNKPKLTCKKCGGNHLTIRCGKNRKNSNSSTVSDKNSRSSRGRNRDQSRGQNYEQNRGRGRGRDRRTNSYRRNNYRDTASKVCVKISNLPEDMGVAELNGLMQDWGRIGRINLKRYTNYNKYNDHKKSYTQMTAYVDFYSKEQAEYFRDAIDRTPMEYQMLSVTILDK